MTVEKRALISDCGAYRYWLTRKWGPGHDMRFIMLNPSVADADIDDPTIRRCMSFAKREGYGGIIVCNLFALRSTDPSALAGGEDPVGPDNGKWIQELVDKCHLLPTVAAWGAHPFATDRAEAVKAMFAKVAGPLWCLGKTQAGHPRHPLYVKGDQPLVRLTGAST